MKILSLIYLSFFMTHALHSKELIVKLPFNTPENQPLYLTGDLFNCQWKVRCLKLNKVGRHLAKLSFKSNPGTFSFKITRGDWNAEASDQHGLPLQNFTFLNSDHLKVLNLVNWKDLGALKKTGVYRQHQIWSPELNRMVSVEVRLPAIGAPKGPRKVIYAHDGHNLFDPKQAKFGIDWSLDEAIEKLPENDRPFVVAVTPFQRESEYNHYREGRNYSDFLASTLKNFIERTYPVRRDSKARILLGSSYGAIISFTTQWLYPEVFGSAICLSFPAHADRYMVQSFVKEFPIRNKAQKIYLDHGNYGGDESYIGPGKYFTRTLRRQYPWLSLQYQVIPFADHTEADWSRRLHPILKSQLMED